MKTQPTLYGLPRPTIYLLVTALAAIVIFSSPPVRAAGCGDGKLDPGEECDNGRYNSDTKPDACRTDCRRPRCGDGVADSREQCDGQDLKYTICTDYSRFHGGFLRCTPDCKFDFSQCTYCGDGLVNHESEACDDGNKLNDDGCNTDCTSCILLDQTGNIEIEKDTELCSREYRLDDYGHYGVIIIARNGVTLDCDGAVLIGEGRGVGIYVLRSNDVTIMNCDVRGYDVGIKIEDAKNVTLLKNRLCGNSQKDIELVKVSETHGENNWCQRSGDWNDDGLEGCSRQIRICGEIPARKTDRKAPSTGAPAQRYEPKATTEQKEQQPKPRKEAPDFFKNLLRNLPEQPKE